jgi:hypothetical protein
MQRIAACFAYPQRGPHRMTQMGYGPGIPRLMSAKVLVQRRLEAEASQQRMVARIYFPSAGMGAVIRLRRAINSP